MKRIAALWLSLVMLFGAFVIVVDLVPQVEGDVIYVGSGGGQNYSTIQEGINAAKDGDTVFVYSGTYVESVKVNKTINLTGEDKDTTIISGSGGDVVTITKGWVNMINFKIINAGFNDVELHVKSSRNIIRDCIVSGGRYGIKLAGGNNRIRNNTVKARDAGILVNTNNNYIENNTVNECGVGTGGYGFGIWLYGCSSNNVANNSISNNKADGIRIDGSSNSKFRNNTFFNDGFCIYASLLNNFIHDIDTSNTVNGKPVYYIKNQNYIEIDGDTIGQLILVNVKHSTIKNINVSCTDLGFEIADSYNVTIENCSFYSNHKGMWIIDENSKITFSNVSIINSSALSASANFASTGVLFENCTISKSPKDFSMGWGSVITTLNTTFDKSKVTVSGSTAKFYAKWYLHVYVNDTYGNPYLGAKVRVRDKFSSTIYTGFTGSNGFCRWIITTQYYQGMSSKTYYTPHLVIAENETHYGLVDVTMDKSKRVNITLGVRKRIHNLNTNEHFVFIQDAIGDADTLKGHTIYVENGTYYENVKVNKGVNLTGENRNNTIINGAGSGDVIRITEDWANVTGFTLTNTSGSYQVVDIYYSQHNWIWDNKVISSVGPGLRIDHSLDVHIMNNIFDDLGSRGVRSFYSTDVYIRWNQVSNSTRGIVSQGGSSVNIKNNHIEGFTERGIEIQSSDYCNVENNTINNLLQGKQGISIVDSEGCTLKNNTMERGGIYFSGQYLDEWNTHTIDATNFVAGNPIYYFKDRIGGTVLQDAGEIILANCSQMDVCDINITNVITAVFLGFSNENHIYNNNFSESGIIAYKSNDNEMCENTIHDSDRAIEISFSDSNDITGNMLISNNIGVYLWNGSYHYIANNTIDSNSGEGIYMNYYSNFNAIYLNNISNNNYGIRILSDSNGNIIYHNNITGNSIQGSDGSSDNYWDNSYPSGGNYWSDYSGFDNYSGPNQDVPGSDGLGDTNYSIDLDSKDNYPLMEPYTHRVFENYTILKQGWNLISIPLIQEEQNLTRSLGSINGWYDSVWLYNVTDTNDPWKHNHISKPSHMNDLWDLNHITGFWIHITNPGDTTFLYNGTQPTENQSIPLYAGWNLVGYPSTIPRNRTDALNNIKFGSDVYRVRTYNTTTQRLEDVGEQDYFQIGKGYWMHSKVEKVWNVPL